MLPLLSHIERWLADLNLFESGSTAVDVTRQERWTTRIHIILLAASVLGLAIYTGFEYEMTYVTITNPSYETFKFLESLYPNTLRCPCANIAIKYETFLELQPTYHQVTLDRLINQRSKDFAIQIKKRSVLQS